MKLSGLLIITLLISLNIFSIDKSVYDNIITKDEIITNKNDFLALHKEVIKESSFSNINDWVLENFHIVNSNSIGEISISLEDKIKFGEVSDNCVVNGNSDKSNTLSSHLSLSEPIEISDYNSLEIRFSQVFKPNGNSNTYLEVSNDGLIWNQIEVNKSIKGELEVVNNVIIDLSSNNDGKDFLWVRFTTNNNSLWIIDNFELQGITNLLPEITTVNPDQGVQGENLSIALSGQFTHFYQGSETVWFEQASQTIMTGSNINVSALTEMNFDLSIPITAPTGLYDVKVQNLTDGIITKQNGFEVFPAPSPNWNYSSTGISHQVLIPSFSTLTIDGVQIDQGDYIGIFYDSLGTPACGGYAGWYGNTIILDIWGDDPFTTEKDGFDISEEFTWIIWDASSNTEYEAIATYQISGFPNLGLFVMNGSSSITDLEAFTYQTQTISLSQGWDIYSTYIDPVNPTLESVFSPVISDLLIVKNGNGQVYWPPYVNLIGNLIIGEGYQANMALANSLDITGSAVVPETTPINIPFGWSIIGYLRQSPANAVTMLNSIVNDIVIVKDGWGSVYWPAWGVNNIGNLIPGGGYQIRVSNAVTLTYPANDQITKSGEYFSSYSLEHYSAPINTGSNMSLCIPLTSWENKPLPGDEIGVFNSKDEIVGCGVFNNENLAFAIWGDDEYTKDKIEYLDIENNFELRLYKNSTGTECNLNISSWLEGGPFYVKDGLSVIESVSIIGSDLKLQNFPNPCLNNTTISFELEDDSHILMNIYNALGELVMNITDTKLAAGVHNFNVDVTNIESGTYFYKLSSGDIEVSKQLIILK